MDDPGIDLHEVVRNIDIAEVLSLYFPFLQKTLLVDTRYDAVEGPLVKLVPKVDSVEDRFKSLRQLRPRFPSPESITVIPWPKQVASLKELGIWDRLVQRFVNSGNAAAVRACDEAYKELLELEKEAVAAIIKGGQGYQTLWERKS